MNCNFCNKHIIDGKIINSIAYCNICLEKYKKLDTNINNDDKNKITDNNLYFDNYDDFHNY